MAETFERRGARRVEIRIPVVYQGPDGARRRGTTANVSGRGMLIVAQETASAGTPLRVAVTGADGHEREVAGRVVRRTAEGHLAIELTEDTPVLQRLIDAEHTTPVD